MMSCKMIHGHYKTRDVFPRACRIHRKISQSLLECAGVREPSSLRFLVGFLQEDGPHYPDPARLIRVDPAWGQSRYVSGRQIPRDVQYGAGCRIGLSFGPGISRYGLCGVESLPLCRCASCRGRTVPFAMDTRDRVSAPADAGAGETLRCA